MHVNHLCHGRSSGIVHEINAYDLQKDLLRFREMRPRGVVKFIDMFHMIGYGSYFCYHQDDIYHCMTVIYRILWQLC